MENSPEVMVRQLDEEQTLIVYQGRMFIVAGPHIQAPQIIFIQSLGNNLEPIGLALNLHHAIEYAKTFNKEYLLEVA